MPYLNCPQCRLTVYTAARHSKAEACPRCDADLSVAPRRLFGPEAAPGRRESGDAHQLIRSALLKTGLFRDGTPRFAGRPSSST
jgi:hypothetical protein